MANIYTTTTQVSVDARLYLNSTGNTQLTLFMFPSIMRGRWGWFVDRFNSFETQFKNAAEGDEEILKKLSDLKRDVEGYKLGNTSINPFENPSKIVDYQPFLERVTIANIRLTADERKVRDDELKRGAELSEDDFRNMISFLNRKSAILATEVGLGDPLITELYGLKGVVKKRNATPADIVDMNKISEAVRSIEGFIFVKQRTEKKPPNLIRAAIGNTTGDSAFVPEDIYQSYVPVNFEISLEHMAKKYLGSVDKWYELAKVNNLKPPYIDKVGEKFTLLAPASTNSVIISAEKYDFLSPGIRVNIGSNGVREQSVIVERVVLNDDGTMVLFIGGSVDLRTFVPSRDAFIRIYTPNTVRNGTLILVPSESPGTQSSPKKTPTKDEIRRLESALIAFGVDIERDEKTNDWIFDAAGNFQLSFGLKAIRQAVRNALRTPSGQLNFHKGYGINYNLGRSYLGGNNEAVLIGDLIRTTILRDPRIDDAKIIRISGNKNGASLQVGVKIKGFSSFIPLNFIT